MLHRHLARCLLLCLGFMPFWSAVASESNAASADHEFRITHWTTDHGLPQNGILSLAQTRDGYLWIGTAGGLARFDGIRFVLFNRSNTPEMQSEIIQALTEDSDGALWIATADGLLVYRNHHFTRFGTSDGLPERQ